MTVPEQSQTAPSSPVSSPVSTPEPAPPAEVKTSDLVAKPPTSLSNASGQKGEPHTPQVAPKDASEVKAEGKETDPKAPKDPKEEKAAQRFAALAKKEARLAKQEQTIKAQTATIQAEAARINRFHSEILPRAKANPVKFLLEEAGLTVDQIVNALPGIAERASLPADPLERMKVELEGKYDKELQEIKAWKEEQLKQKQEQEQATHNAALEKTMTDFAANTVAPFLSQHAEKYSHTLAMFGDDTSRKIVDRMIQASNETGGKTMPQFSQVADDFETYLRGVSERVAPKSTKAIPKEEPAPAISEPIESASKPSALTNDKRSLWSAVNVKPAEKRKTAFQERAEDNARIAAKLALANRR